MGKRGGRPTRLTAELRDQLMQIIALGATIEDSCGQIGISKQTFYNWCTESERLRSIADSLWEMGIGMPVSIDQIVLLTFLDALNRARAEAKVVAVAAIRTAMFGSQQLETAIETITETRLRRGPNGEQIPYQYTRTVNRTINRQIAGDWHAALEYLRRRHPEEWGDRLRVDWRQEAIALIKSGELEYDDVAAEWGEDGAAELFVRAGVPVPRT